MKLVRHYLENIAGIEVYPIISFVLFFTLFLFITWYVIKMDKDVIEEVSNYALDENDEMPHKNQS
ncbi:hypothetical protein [Carboxylicivirga linearis]|uniref:CcoQ/FixQ family Cbb3-type cytochrome c oxidase assembly chaperone n=1 Tax=Carboxylicivirga linearis TaxID=1628157 RepID=A0ABS5JRI6_9BACT|nr:hypothetical protein [Carboxylicivirga linearis]MBS2097430.1 hypothetical protein [Carboxylicivirga linearis]